MIELSFYMKLENGIASAEKPLNLTYPVIILFLTLILYYFLDIKFPIFGEKKNCLT